MELNFLLIIPMYLDKFGDLLEFSMFYFITSIFKYHIQDKPNSLS